MILTAALLVAIASQDIFQRRAGAARDMHANINAYVTKATNKVPNKDETRKKVEKVQKLATKGLYISYCFMVASTDDTNVSVGKNTA